MAALKGAIRIQAAGSHLSGTSAIPPLGLLIYGCRGPEGAFRTVHTTQTGSGRTSGHRPRGFLREGTSKHISGDGIFPRASPRRVKKNNLVTGELCVPARRRSGREEKANGYGFR